MLKALLYKLYSRLMIITYTLIVMLISSITLLLYINHLNALSQKELKGKTAHKKLKDPIQRVKIVDRRMLEETV